MFNSQNVEVKMKTEMVVEHFGTKTAVARALGINKSAVSQWGENVPRGKAFEIEALTGGALKANPFAPAPRPAQ